MDSLLDSGVTSSGTSSGESLSQLTADSPPKMDSLLEKLRKGMTELSHQGDDFTKQMWNMYATFEDLISAPAKDSEADRERKDSSEVGLSGPPECVDRLRREAPPTASASLAGSQRPEVQSKGDLSTVSETDVHSHRVSLSVDKKGEQSAVTVSATVPAANTEKPTGRGTATVPTGTNFVPQGMRLPVESQKPKPTEKPTALPRKVQNLPSRNGYQSDSGSSSSITNHLLDTISTLTSSDPYSDSDDCCDINSKVYHQRQSQRRRRRVMAERHLRRSPQSHHHSSQSSDGDSIGYAGSNSIDSGYKSLCPTPEISEGMTLYPFEAIDRRPSLSKSNRPTPSPSQLEANNKKLEKERDRDRERDRERDRDRERERDREEESVSTGSRVLSSHPSDRSHINININPNASQARNCLPKPRPRASVTGAPGGPGGAGGGDGGGGAGVGVGLYSAKIANRLKSQQAEAHLEHLLHLRQSLLSAIHKCESTTSSPSPSRGGSPVVSSRSSSPASTIIAKTNKSMGGPQSPLLCNKVSFYGSKGKRLPATPVGPEPIPRQTFSPQTKRRLLLPKLSIASRLQQQNKDSSSCESSSPTASTASLGSPSQNKSVRFDNEVKVTSLNALNQANVAAVASESNLRLRAKQEIELGLPPSPIYASKSILKDPLCAAVRSQIEAGEFGSECSLEKEIDSLLYGKRENDYYSMSDYDLEVPYVSMIEDKYKVGKAAGTESGLVKLRETAVGLQPQPQSQSQLQPQSQTTSASFADAMDDDLDLITKSELTINATLTTTRTQGNPSSRRTLTQAMGQSQGNKGHKSSRSRFTEMAKCMLEILDDLQPTPDARESEAALDALKALGSACESPADGKGADSGSQRSSLSYNTLPEYHIYEEVMYDAMEAFQQHPGHGTSIPSSGGCFHPSAANDLIEKTQKDADLRKNGPPLGFSEASRNAFGWRPVDINYSARAEFPGIKSSQALGSWGRTSNRPKQRNNLYSLFSDPSQRRNISRSLEREWRCNFGQRDAAGDFEMASDVCTETETETVVTNYGFKASV